jgi:sporulation protein YlmC with PRC-barrel domain
MYGTQANLSWRGRDVLDAEGHRVGRLEEVYLDDATDQPRWAAVRERAVGRRLSLVPLANATMRADYVAVPVTAGAIDEAPHIDSARELTGEEAACLERHYGAGARDASDTGAAPKRR